VIAGLLAFAGCLRADFYMDDFVFILHSNGNEPAPRRYDLPLLSFTTGEQGPDMQPVNIFQIIPTAFFVLTEHLVPNVRGASWLYHFWNLLFHLATVCFAFTAGRNVLALAGMLKSDRERSIAALIGAALFACHPLCSEPLNYAKCMNSLTVGMFGMMAVSGAAKWLKSGGRRPLWLALGGLAGATLSYPPGLALAPLWLGVLVLFRLRSPAVEGESSEGNFSWIVKNKSVVISAVVLGGALVAWKFGGIFLYRWRSWADLFPAYILTQGRLLWEYLARVVVPVGLCSDHFVPWSVPWKDGGAMAGLIFGGVVALGATVLILRRRGGALRGWGLLTLLAFLPLLMRFGYVIPELFVEYRAYPALPWFMLMVGTAMVALATRFPRLRLLPIAGGAAVAAVWILLSLQRNQTWTSRESLARDVLERYPLNDRALTQLQSEALDESNLQEVKALHERVLALKQGIADFNLRNPTRRYDTGRASDSIFRSFGFMVWAMAFTDGSAKGLEWTEKMIETLRLQMPEKFEPDSFGLTRAYPLLMARDAVAAHREEIDARIKEFAARAAAGGGK
jgi:hypothetical protein